MLGFFGCDSFKQREKIHEVREQFSKQDTGIIEKQRAKHIMKIGYGPLPAFKVTAFFDCMITVLSPFWQINVLIVFGNSIISFGYMYFARVSPVLVFML